MSSPSTPAAAPAPARRPRWFRRKVVVDARTQWRVALMLASGLVVLAVAQVLALPTAFTPDPDALFDGEQVRLLVVRVGLIQFGVAAVLTLVLGLLLSHRFSGAALVLGRALKAMREGDDAGRLALRRGDFLHHLATEIALLRDAHAERAGAQDEALRHAESALAEGDLTLARGLIEEARRLARLPLASAQGAPLAQRTPSAVA